MPEDRIGPPFICVMCGRLVSLDGTDTVKVAVGYAHGVCIRHRAALLEQEAADG